MSYESHPLRRWHIFTALALLSHIAGIVPLAVLFWIVTVLDFLSS